RAARPERTPLRLRTPRVNLLLGTSLAEAEVERLLRPLGFVAEPAAEGEFEVMVPTWRPDCQREVDLIEEVARLHGYDRIPRTLPARPVGSTGLTPYQRGRRSVREILAGAGSSEAWCPSFTSVAELVATGLDPAFALEVENPLDQSQSMLRPSLLPGLLRAARFNKERQAGALSLFEIGSVFCRPGEADDEIRPLQDVKEWEQLGLLAIGAGADARYAVRLWEVLAGALRLERAGLTRLEHAGRSGRGALAAAAAFHPRRRQVIVLGGEPAGLVGELAKAVGERHGLGGRIAALVVDMAPLLGAPRRSWQAVHASRYPAIDLDLSLVVEDKVAAADVAATLAKAAGELVESMALFDVWRGESLGEGRRSLAFRLRLRAGDRTLTDEEVDRVRRDAARAAVLAHGAVLRAG
ncbi:MAG TPA: hypothetical protein VED59_01750, partial [Acidimicrobiales bacterium]|nr:hypothetical protein [Acidimicrobiales bacterium]